MTRDPAKLHASSPVSPGDVVAGKYRVERLLAAGGMGVVAVARHLELDQEVAVKVVLDCDQDADRVTRFLREARAAARIDSDYVARVFDCGKLADGRPYMAMELLSGCDLRELLRERGPLPVTEAVDLIIDACRGVADAHAVGLVHRDLKPANLFCVDRHGRRSVKVLDFGIAKATGSADAEELTQPESVLGSPRYMAPEQARSSKHVDARADIWSLGVVLYELLDGNSPFAGSSIGETIGNILQIDPVPLNALRPDVPEALSLVVARCLRRDRERRYPTVAELTLALAPFGSNPGERMALPPANVPLAPASERPRREVSDDAPAMAKSAPERPRKRGAALLLLAGAVVGSVASALLITRLAGTAPSPAPSPPPAISEVIAPVSASPPPEPAAAPPTESATARLPPSAAPSKPRAATTSRPAPKRNVLETSD